MRRTTIGTIAALAFCASTVVAQVNTVHSGSAAYRQSAVARPGGEQAAPTASHGVNANLGFPASPLSPQVSVSGADVLPMSSRYDAVSNGRAIHNLVVDPDDPNKLHFIAMVLTDNTEADTTRAAGNSSRRVQYSYSSDGGKNWKAPVIIGDVRLGYPDITLYKHNGVNVPIIAAHNGPNAAGNTNWSTKVYFEQGQPGDGNFATFDLGRTDSKGNTSDIGYPSLALSPSQDKLYVVGCGLNTGTSNPVPLEFGYFDLSGATPSWSGWKGRPGGDDITANCINGQDVLRVAPDGRLGLLWVNADISDKGLYFVESTDGGTSWTSPYVPFYIPDASDGTLTGILAHYDGLDFWYDVTNKAHYVWQMDYYQYTGSGLDRYYPNTGMVLYWAKGDPLVKILSSIYQPQFTSLQLNNEFVNDTVLYVPTYFTPVSGYEPTGQSFISKVTTSLSSNPNYFRVYYASYQDNDTMTVDELGDGSSMKVYLYRDIFFQETTDGGSTWTEPAQFIGNDPANTDPLTHLDFHAPSPALWNASVAGQTQYHVNFQVDTFPGVQFGNGQAGWTYNTWYHKSAAVAAVHSGTEAASNQLGANFPNPAVASTTVPVTMIESETATLSIVDMLGRTVRTVYRGTLGAGTTDLKVETASLTPGVYRYVLTTPTFSAASLMSVVH